MNELDQRFQRATEIAERDIGFKPETAVLLQSYALYKQATIGDIEGERPDEFVAVAKYAAWERLEGMSADEAKRQYVDLVENTLAQ